MANEKRLIDVNWVLEEIEHDLGCYEIGTMEKGDALFVDLRDVVRMVCDAPTVDAVEVVRCQDCAHWHEETGWCNKHSHFIGAEGEACHPWESSQWKMLGADDFCSWGERRADDG